MVVSGRVGLLVVVAVVEHGLAGDTLLSTSDGCDFPDGPGRPVPNVPSLDRLGIAFAGGGALHLGVAVRVDGTQLLVLVLHSTRERVGNVVIVIVLTLALHEEAGALHKLVHRHGVVLGGGGEETGDARCGQCMVWVVFTERFLCRSRTCVECVVSLGR